MVRFLQTGFDILSCVFFIFPTCLLADFGGSKGGVCSTVLSGFSVLVLNHLCGRSILWRLKILIICQSSLPFAVLIDVPNVVNSFLKILFQIIVSFPLPTEHLSSRHCTQCARLPFQWVPDASVFSVVHSYYLSLSLNGRLIVVSLSRARWDMGFVCVFGSISNRAM